MPMVGLSDYAAMSGGDGANGKELPPFGPGGIYHEKQIGSLCAIHCVNNLLQGPKFSEQEFRRVTQELDRAEAALMGGASMDYGNARSDGFFNVQVVQAVLSKSRYEMDAMSSEAARNNKADTAKETAFILNKNEHWFSVRRIGREWFDLNSCIKVPRHYSDADLRFHISDAVKEGYQVFVVRGDFPKCALELGDPKKLVEAIQGCGRPDQGYSLFAGSGQTLSSGPGDAPAAAPIAQSDAAALRAARLARFGGGGAPAPAAQPPADATPAQRNSESLNTLLAMGFAKEQSERALQAASGNVERAAESLLQG
eukprot:CAMPEP_0115090290 /NCGR_PEP_ID=MMETSP0227-20121206/25324_1 /TAXON_ID=89957 /ORGANISM="Polarella glacialis, Strain CCMP 1383" /LENGTH=311 /DNA_ID=CAMNT_0002481373 /DNA_START=26 /DNA_END=962 /DNA_ORIENTATION=-